LPEVPTPTFTPEIVFVPTHQINFVPPVYIWVDFSGAADASAAGDECLYRLEIVDSGRTHVRTLFSKKVTTDSQRWMEWDGKDDQGQLMQPGNYYAIFSKDGEARPPVALHWWPANPDQ
jgi:flagellar hook assembly protein FlgD